MDSLSRVALLLVLLLSPAAFGVGADGPADPSASTEVEAGKTEDRIREAWNEIHKLQRAGKSAEAEQRQREFAREFFENYLAHPETSSGRQALATAFRMWGHAGDHEAIESAMARVDRGSRYWEQLIRLARPAFAGADRLADYRGIAAELAGELTDPQVAAEVWIFLGRDYRSTGELVAAADSFRRVLALEIEPRLLEAARTALRELDRLAVGRSAPGFTAVDLEGRRVSLSDLSGRFVLLQFWSSECSDCLPEIDHLRWVRAAYPPEQLELIGVALDTRAEDALRVIEERRLDWPQICDGQAKDGPVARLYEVSEVPRSFLIDREGKVVARNVGGEELDALLAELLPREQETEPSTTN